MFVSTRPVQRTHQSDIGYQTFHGLSIAAKSILRQDRFEFEIPQIGTVTLCHSDGGLIDWAGDLSYI